MNQLIDFVGVAAAIAISLGLALLFEWLTLRGFMCLMPATTRLELKPVAANNPADRPKAA
jgi:hypothetical protein